MVHARSARIKDEKLCETIRDLMRLLAEWGSKDAFDRVAWRARLRQEFPKQPANLKPEEEKTYKILLGFMRAGRHDNSSLYLSSGNDEWRGVTFEQIEAAYVSLRKLAYAKTIAAPSREQVGRWIEPFNAAIQEVDGQIKRERRTKARPLTAESGVDHPSVDYGVHRDYAWNLRRFLKPYIRDRGTNTPFGGRTGHIEYLDGWLFDRSGSSSLFMLAPALRGKTALILEWMRQLPRRRQWRTQRWQIIFVPISARAETVRPDVYLRLLLARLAEITGRQFSSGPPFDPTTLKQNVSSQLDLLAKSKSRFLLVVDGLDEAVHGEFDATIIPENLPPTVKILLAARRHMGAVDTASWQRRIGWQSRTELESFPELQLLGPPEIHELLEALDLAGNGYDLKLLAEEMSRFTMGEPALVRAVVEDILERSAEGPRISTGQLSRMQSGYHGYFATWWEEQCKLWREESKSGASVRVESAERLVAILSVARGPLESGDLADICAIAHADDRNVSVSRLLLPLRRWVLGDGTRRDGFIFCHPVIGQHFAEANFPDLARRMEPIFAEWGMLRLSQLEENAVTPSGICFYMLQHLGEHLRACNAPLDAHIRLVHNTWRRAWEAVDPSGAGFAADVVEVWRSLQSTFGFRVKLGWQLRCALVLCSIRNSVRSLSKGNPNADVVAPATEALARIQTNLPDWLMAYDPSWERLEDALVAEDYEITSLHHDYGGRYDKIALVHALVELARYGGTRPRIVDSLFSIVLESDDVAVRFEGCLAIIDLIDESRRPAVINALLSAAERIVHRGRKAEALVAVIPYGDDSERMARIQAAREALALALPNSELMRAYARLAEIVGPDLRAVCITEAIEVARAAEYELDRFPCLCRLMDFLPKSDHPPIITRCLRFFEFGDPEMEFGYFSSGCFMLAELAKYLEVEHYEVAMKIARRLPLQSDREIAVRGLYKGMASRLLPHQLTELMEFARELDCRLTPPELSPTSVELITSTAIMREGQMPVWSIGEISKELTEDLYPSFVTTIIKAIPRIPREDAFAAIAVCAHCIHAMEGDEAIANTYNAIIDVVRWYPRYLTDYQIA